MLYRMMNKTGKAAAFFRTSHALHSTHSGVCVCVGIISIFKSCYFPFLSQQQPEADNYTDMLSLKK